MRLRGTFDRQEITKKNLHDIKEVIVSSSFSRPFFLLSTIALRLEPSWLVCTLNRIRTVDSDWLKKKKPKSTHTHTVSKSDSIFFCFFFIYFVCFFFFGNCVTSSRQCPFRVGPAKWRRRRNKRNKQSDKKKNNSTLNVFNLIPSSIDVECAWS